MVLPVPGEGARGLVSFRLFGVPVSIHASFLVVAFAFGLVDQTIEAALVWTVVVTLSVLAHELGHALVAPRDGHPSIDLYALAGLTRWQPGQASRARRVAVSVAGVAAGCLLGVAMIVVDRAVAPDPTSLLGYALEAAVFANLYWGLVNLVPMLPLDGGQVVRALMPGADDNVRDRRTAIVSLVVAAVLSAGVLAVVGTDGVVMVAFIAFFAMGNVQILNASKQMKTGAEARERLVLANHLLDNGRAEEAYTTIYGDLDHPLARVVGAAALLRMDRPREAQHLLLDLPDFVKLDPTFEATVLLANGQERLARERLATSLRTAETWAIRELALQLHRRGDDLDAAFAGVTGEGAAAVQMALFFEGAYTESARWGERALGSGSENPYVALNVACAWSRAGDLDRALRSVDHAILLGLPDPSVLDSDPDLAAAREHPQWAVLRRRAAPADGEEAKSGRWLENSHPLVKEAIQAIYAGRAEDGYELVRRHRGPGTDNAAAGALIVLGRLREAERRLHGDSAEVVNHALTGALLLLRGQDEDARRLLSTYPPEMMEAFGAYVAALAARRCGRNVEEVFGDNLSDWRIRQGVGSMLFYEGAYAEAAEWHSAVGDHPVLAYNAACSWARLGDADRALEWVGTALDRGWDDAEQLDSDEDLAAVRAHPGWAAVRARLGAPTASG